MKKTEPIPARKQPLLWKQAINKALHRGYSVRNILLYPLVEMKYPFKHHKTYLFDHLIIGSNPILTYLIMLKLHDLTLNQDSANLHKIGIVLNDDFDYWAYHAFEKTDLWNEINNAFKINYGLSFQDMLNKRNNLFFDESRQECVFINSKNFKIKNCRYDDHAQGYVLHLEDKERNKDNKITHNFQPNMPTILKLEKNISEKYKNSFISRCEDLSKHYHGNFKQLHFPDKKEVCKDTQEASHVVLTKHLWLTSQPQNWINYLPVSDENCTFTTHENEIFNDTQFIYKDISRLNKYSFGTARHIANDFYGLEKQSLVDIIDLLKTNFNDLI